MNILDGELFSVGSHLLSWKKLARTDACLTLKLAVSIVELDDVEFTRE